jgi:gamma-glutamylputrescine oxidase
MSFARARQLLGPERAAALWRLTERTLDRMDELAGDALRRVGSLRLAADENERAELVAEHEALRGDGFAAEWVDEGRLAGRYAGAILHPLNGALHPGRWIRRLAARTAEAGAEIREHDSVESLADLDAETVVVASGGYPTGLAGALDSAVQPTRGQVVITEPLGSACTSDPTTPATASITGNSSRTAAS